MLFDTPHRVLTARLLVESIGVAALLSVDAPTTGADAANPWRGPAL